jgi:hypothetical protein
MKARERRNILWEDLEGENKRLCDGQTDRHALYLTEASLSLRYPHISRRWLAWNSDHLQHFSKEEEQRWLTHCGSRILCNPQDYRKDQPDFTHLRSKSAFLLNYCDQ